MLIFLVAIEAIVVIVAIVAIVVIVFFLAGGDACVSGQCPAPYLDIHRTSLHPASGAGEFGMPDFLPRARRPRPQWTLLVASLRLQACN